MARYSRSAIPSSLITPEAVWLSRRSLLAAGGLMLAGGMAGRAGAQTAPATPAPAAPAPNAPALVPTDEALVTAYNNFYEFGTGKTDPAANAGSLTTKPWTVKIDGLVGKPGDYALEDLIPATLEDRIYRFRCVEAWSAVIPWQGFPLAALLARVEPQPSAKYVAFETLVRPEEMPGQNGLFQPLEWPYVEGLRLDEAMHPLTLMATGIYGKPLPNQNGAPIRLVVPWKYGFKSIKSIVRISLTETEPPTTWNRMAPQEYGFYANVNPAVDHPRWSQATERPLGGGLLAGSQPTLPFNGYGAEVADLYAGMDLAKFY